MEVLIIFGGLLSLLFYFSNKRGEIEKPFEVEEKADAIWGVPLSFGVLVVIAMLFMGLMGNSIDGSAYSLVESNGTKEMLDFFIFCSLIVCIGLLMIINGIWRGLGVILLIVGILGSIGVTELVR